MKGRNTWRLGELRACLPGRWRKVYHFGRDGSELHHFEHERGRVALLKHLWPDVTLSRLGAGPELIELIEWGMELEDLGDAPPDARQASYTAIRALAYQVLRRCSLAA